MPTATDSTVSERARAFIDRSLVWDNTFPFGDSCGSPTRHRQMLARMQGVGYDCVSLTMVVREMNRVGMLVDCTHTGYRTSMDVFEVAAGPVIFSHSNSRALIDHERNIRDDQAKACAKTGGVIGLNGVGIFLGGNEASADGLFRHLDHFVQLVGARHVGLGLDVVTDREPLLEIVRAQAARYPASQGYDVVPEFGWPELVPQVTERMLAAGYADADVEGILGGNWLRVASQVWKPAAA